MRVQDLSMLLLMGFCIVAGPGIAEMQPRTDFEQAIRERADELDHPAYPPENSPCGFPDSQTPGSESDKAKQWSDACICQLLADLGLGPTGGQIPPSSASRDWDQDLRNLLACNSQNPHECTDCPGGGTGTDPGEESDPPETDPPTGPPFTQDRWGKKPSELNPGDVVYLLDYFLAVVTDKTQEVRDDQTIQGDGHEQREIAQRIKEQMLDDGVGKGIANAFGDGYLRWTYGS